jgi:DNA-binding PadR family transcriptional regulator
MGMKQAVLGLVIEQPDYGYRLAQRLEDRCPSGGWQKTGVYGALDQLTKESLVRSLGEKGPSDSGRAPTRRIYEATPEGVDDHERWIFEPSPLSPLRQELDLKMLVAGSEYLPRLIEQTRAQERQCLEEIKALTHAAPAPCHGRPRTWPQARIVLQRDAEIKTLRLRIECLQDARSAMKLILDESASNWRRERSA